jgi:hypothetical protein
LISVTALPLQLATHISAPALTNASGSAGTLTVLPCGAGYVGGTVEEVAESTVTTIVSPAQLFGIDPSVKVMEYCIAEGVLLAGSVRDVESVPVLQGTKPPTPTIAGTTANVHEVELVTKPVRRTSPPVLDNSDVDEPKLSMVACGVAAASTFGLHISAVITTATATPTNVKFLNVKIGIRRIGIVLICRSEEDYFVAMTSALSHTLGNPLKEWRALC